MLFNIKEYRLSARVEHAPDGQWIAASEWQVREIFQKLMSESYQQMLQARMDAAPQAAFSPSRPPPAQGQRQASGPRAYRRRLDSYHLAQHVHEAARCCLGEGEAARAWAGARLKDVKQGGAKALLAGTDALGKQVRASRKKEPIRRLRQYVWKRREMLDYPTALANGWDIGSGPTEATCKTLTLRLKRPGMKWDRDHAAGMMNLIAMRESGQWKAYWTQRAAA